MNMLKTKFSRKVCCCWVFLSIQAKKTQQPEVCIFVDKILSDQGADFGKVLSKLFLSEENKQA